MFPSFDQIQHAAYLRWERRWYSHGQHREDWLAAEQDLLFTLNYKLLVHYVLSDREQRLLGNKARPVCRFCERSTPAVNFRVDTPAVPEFLGNRSLFTIEECEDCQSLFAEGIEAELEDFLTSFRKDYAFSASERSGFSLPVAVFKGLIKQALAIMPRGDLASFEGATEWVCNPDHDFDADLFAEARGHIHVLAEPVSEPWVAIAKRTDIDAPMPAMLFFLGTRHLVAQVALPLCDPDDDLEGVDVTVPRIASLMGLGRGGDLIPSVSLPLSLAGSRPFALLR